VDLGRYGSSLVPVLFSLVPPCPSISTLVGPSPIPTCTYPSLSPAAPHNHIPAPPPLPFPPPTYASLPLPILPLPFVTLVSTRYLLPC
ncbi:hypothetical protein B0H17DRAFT_1088208, partial [Mycena rosella]